MCAGVWSLWPGVVSVGCEEGKVLQDVSLGLVFLAKSGLFGQVWFVWAVKRGQSCRMCAWVWSLRPGVVSVGCEEGKVL